VTRELRAQVELARGGDSAALSYVAAACHGEAIRMASSVLRDRHRAEDAAQEGLLIALQRLPELRDPGAFRGWLATIVRSQALRQLRKRQPDLIDQPDLRSDPALDEPVVRAGAAELRALVRAAVAGLTPATRVVSERFYLDGLTLAETAASLGLPDGTVKRRLFEARERLRLSLAGVGRAQHPQTPPKRRRLRRPL